MLGSVRAVTNADGAVLECYDYLPFGRMLGSSDNGRVGCHPASPDTALDSETSQKFTGQIRDEETRLDYFGARYMSAPQGRFLSPDPLMASAKTTDPQSWNRYIYTLNNPLRYVDPDGLDVPKECVEDKNCEIVVNLNVIYDSTVNNGQGFTNEQKKEFEQDQLAKAQGAYETSNIKLNVDYTEGSYVVDANGGQAVVGLNANAANLVVSNRTPNGRPGASLMTDEPRIPVSIVNFNTVSDRSANNTTVHELGHQFIGDVYRPIAVSPIYRHFRAVARDIVVGVRVAAQAAGIRQQGFREGLTHRVYAAPLNPEANEPRQ